MLRSIFRGSCAAVCALAVVGAATASTDAGAAKRGLLRLVTAQPVVLKGSSFHARERVKVTIQVAGRDLVRRVVATRAGSFRVALDDNVVLDRCNSSFAVRAVGGRGTQAFLKMPQLLCPPALAPPD